jgi:molybdopterin biosynthesis enzyme MoaB
VAEQWAAEVVIFADRIGRMLEQRHPADTSLGYRTIPDDGVKDISAVITLVVAQILQAWLDAGSERDVTIEALNEVIENHVAEWSTSSAAA